MPRTRHVDRLGAVLAALMAAALALPFVVAKANRIVPGDPQSLRAVLPPAAALGCLAAVGVAAA
ncbi:MAG: ABC transporter permease, partial [Gammaproteobacteria bacterium]|nr:ABC transporter permease [Gammaproteobacteria bacterium]